MKFSFPAGIETAIVRHNAASEAAGEFERRMGVGREDESDVDVRRSGDGSGAAAVGSGSMVRWLTLLALGVAAGMLALGTVILVDARTDAWQQAEEASENLVLALTRDIARNIAAYDLSLQGAIDAMQQPGIETVGAAIRHQAIFDRAATAEYLGSLLVLGTDGTILADSTSLVPSTSSIWGTATTTRCMSATRTWGCTSASRSGAACATEMPASRSAGGSRMWMAASAASWWGRCGWPISRACSRR